MVVGSKQDVLFIAHKKGRIYVTCTRSGKGFYVIADQNGRLAVNEGFSKKLTISHALENLKKMNQKKR